MKQSEISPIRALSLVLQQPKFLLRAVIYTFLMIFVLLWLVNLPTLGYVYGVNPRLVPAIIIDSYINLVRYGNNIVPIGIIVIGIMQGILLAEASFYRQTTKGKLKNAQFGGLGIGVVAASCVSCGGSIIAPLFTGLFGSLSVIGSQIISFIGFAIAAGLLARSLYLIGQKNAKVISKILSHKGG